MAKSQLKKMCKNVRIARTAKVLKIVSESRLPALVHNILIPVSLLIIVYFHGAALCAKQTQHLIHFVPTQGPFFFSHHPFSKRVRHFGTDFLPLCIKRPLNFYVMQHIFGQKRHFML